MTRKRRRLYLVLGGMGCLGVAVALVLNAFNDDLVFFYSPSDLVQKHPTPGRTLRIGGLVEDGSVKRLDGGKQIDFKVTDGKHDVAVAYTGVLPDLFREGQGVIAEGALTGTGTIVATQVLAKHDEKYMPPDVVAALKKSGEWQEDKRASAAASPALQAARAPMVDLPTPRPHS
ncbi:MAG TPA: cytochrome c maturation protein CcmE [Stellaceae bacterium]|nr:cytochrome c maturation protein CcmE [Stellaceae bacterium]